MTRLLDDLCCALLIFALACAAVLRWVDGLPSRASVQVVWERGE